MRVLILSASTNGGHNSTAAALAEQFQKMNVECEIFDSLTLHPEKMSSFVEWGHSYVYRGRIPRLIRRSYRYEEQYSPKKIYEFCARSAEALQEKLLSESFDAVISVHVFPCLMMTEVRQAYGNPIPSYFVATDYACSPGVNEMQADGYFIPHRMLFGDFVRAMIPANKLYATGIPVKSDFYRPVEKAEARRLLGLPEQERIVLLSCGSRGRGHLEKHALELSNRLPDDVRLIVLCGKNQALYDDLDRFESPRINIIGFTDHIPLYMSAADLYLTKPGGLMTTEAIAKKLPMVFVDAVPGCETHNYDFLTRCGVAEGGKTWKLAIEQVLRLLANPNAIEEIREKMVNFLPSSAAEQICRWVIRN